jgi:hypothetical protein
MDEPGWHVSENTMKMGKDMIDNRKIKAIKPGGHAIPPVNESSNAASTEVFFPVSDRPLPWPNQNTLRAAKTQADRRGRPQPTSS